MQYFDLDLFANLLNIFINYRAGFYVGDESEEESEGNGLIVEGIGLNDSYPSDRKSQVQYEIISLYFILILPYNS